jgi:ABC-type multidrug transport system fused ATPase/permease subunit
MNAFKRVFKYIRPQWPRITVVVVSAIVVAALLSLSFMTVIPLLKVMMGREGLHGWLDRRICEWRYGLEFYVPEVADLAESPTGGIAHYLRVTKVKKDSHAQAAGLRPEDKIVGAGTRLIEQPGQTTPFFELLDELAGTDAKSISVQLKRFGNEQEGFVDIPAELDTHPDNGLKTTGVALAQWAKKVLPEERSEGGRTRAVIYIIIGVGVITIIRCIAKFYQGYLAEKVVQVGICHLRRDAFAHILDMPIGFFAGEKPSDTVSRLIRDTGEMGRGIKILLGKALREPLNALFFICAAMALSWQLTLIFLCASPMVLWLVAVLGKKMKRAARKSLMAWSQMLAKLQETVAGLKVVKVYNQQPHEQATFETVNRRLLKQLLKISKVDAATTPILEVLGMAAGSVALVFGASWVTRNQMDPTSFFVLLILLGSAAEAVRKTSDLWNKIQEANAAAERVFALMDEPLEKEGPGAFDLPPLRERIEFRDVWFTYPGADRPVLKGINLSVEAGHNVAIVGPNGSGKTTLANLIPRFYEPDSGQVLIDGLDIRDAALESLRSQIGMVTQNLVTFNDTIAANIAYGNLGATEPEIIAAAERSFAHEFIEPLPYAYDTIIGEHGTGLSGGQLQRIAIARAIIKNPAILIFDEATSQVDADSEAKIHNAIEDLMHHRTSFIIAHRFSTVITADVIVVMDDGQIIAQGRHDELMQSCPLYQSLYETQLVKT